MLGVNIWRRMLGVDNRTVIEGIDYDEDAEAVVAHVRQRKATKRRCGLCGKRAPLYDQGGGRRLWRALDLGLLRVFLEANSPRVTCKDHGVTVAQVPWARHGAGHTTAFDDTIAWLTTRTPKSTVCEMFRIAWSSVGSIIGRVVDEAHAVKDPLDGLKRIGIDEISYKRGHKYLTIIVDHDTGNLVWAAVGRDKDTLGTFFDALGSERAKEIKLVSADAAEWISTVVAEKCKNATLCLDPFHIVAWATDALDEVRRDIQREARKAGMTAESKEIKGARYALWKNPENLTANQNAKLSEIAKTNGALYRAYLLKEQLRQAFAIKGPTALVIIDDWLSWASRSRIPAFVELARKIRRHRDGIEAALVHGLSNALIESTNTKLRVLTRMAFGFREPEHLIALAMLDRGGVCPLLPGRETG